MLCDPDGHFPFTGGTFTGVGVAPDVDDVVVAGVLPVLPPVLLPVCEDSDPWEFVVGGELNTHSVPITVPPEVRQLSIPNTHLSPIFILPAEHTPNTGGILGRRTLFDVE